jgi:hypothetical protein
MGSIGNREKIKIEYSEHSIQQALRYNFLSPSSVKYFTENLNVYSWESDVLKFTNSGYAYEFEIKISKADFKNDFKNKKKKHALLENKEDVNKPNYFYYVVPEGLVTEDEVPEYAGLIYVYATIIGNGRPYYSFNEVKKAPKLHTEKMDVEKLKLVDKFYYNYIHWKHKHEKDIIDYKERLDRMKLFEGKTYKYTLPDAMSKIEELEKEKQMWIDNGEKWKKLAQEEIGIQRRLTRKLVELGVTAKELEEIIGQAIIYID